MIKIPIFSPSSVSCKKTSDQSNIPQVLRSDPPPHEKPVNDSFSDPNQLFLSPIIFPLLVSDLYYLKKVILSYLKMHAKFQQSIHKKLESSTHICIHVTQKKI